MHTIIGFLTYEDFIAEIAGVAPVVRVQAYYKPIGDMGERVEYFVEAAARREYPPQDEIYVVRFRIGSAWAFDDDQVEQIRQKADKVTKTLRHDLERRGFGVKPGLFATTRDAEIVTDPAFFDRTEA
jgi:hypothetical protein